MVSDTTSDDAGGIGVEGNISVAEGSGASGDGSPFSVPFSSLVLPLASFSVAAPSSAGPLED